MALVSGTQATSVTAAALPAGPCRSVVVHNDDAAIIMSVGNSSTQSYTLGPGQSVKIQVTNRNQVYVKAASATPTLSYISD